MFTKIRNLPYAILASATVALTAENANAQASGTLGTIATDVKGQVGNIGQLMVAGGFLLGIIMIIAGLIKLKAAADTQGNQVKYSEGLWRLAVGAGLVAVPALSGVLGESLGLGQPSSMTNAGGVSF